MDLFDMFGNLEGLKLEEALKLLPTKDNIRIIDLDKETGETTTEWKFGRINIVVKGGLVEQVYEG